MLKNEVMWAITRNVWSLFPENSAQKQLYAGQKELERTEIHGKKVFPVGKKLDQLNVNKHVLLILDP